MVVFIIICAMIMTTALLGYLVPRWQLDPVKSLIGGFLIFGATGLITLNLYNINHTLTIVQVIYIEFFITAMLCAGLVLILFSRDPERMIPKEKHVLLSPADGSVCYIHRIDKGELPVSKKGNQTLTLDDFIKTDLKTNVCYQIGIAMRTFDVHVNRAPVPGNIVSQQRISGHFISLQKSRSWFRSARMLTVFDQGQFHVGVVQIASRLVHRIVNYRKPGDSVQMGDRFGMIQFGSQVDVILPELNDMRLCVKIGDTTRAGETILVKYQD